MHHEVGVDIMAQVAQVAQQSRWPSTAASGSTSRLRSSAMMTMNDTDEDALQMMGSRDEADDDEDDEEYEDPMSQFIARLSAAQQVCPRTALHSMYSHISPSSLNFCGCEVSSWGPFCGFTCFAIRSFHFILLPRSAPCHPACSEARYVGEVWCSP